MTSTTSWDAEADVVVLGFGAAGCAAAIAARDAGASVIVLEKMPEGKEGGNTRVSGGIWFHNPDVEGLKTYLRALCAEYPVPEAVISVWSEETAKNTDWLEGIGAEPAMHGDYQPEYPELEGSEAYGGYLGVEGEMGGGRLYDVLAAAVRSKGADVRLDTPGRELVQDKQTGEILGVVAGREGETLRVRARRGVVLATGGFEANPQMVRDYLRLSDSPVWGSPAGTGDGIKMAQKVGADLWHMHNMMSTIGLRAPGFESGFYVAFVFAFGFLYTGADGTRCVNELPQVGHGQAILHGNYKLFPDQPMHVVFDETTRLAGPLSPPSEVLDVGWNVRIEGYDWSMDNSRALQSGLRGKGRRSLWSFGRHARPRRRPSLLWFRVGTAARMEQRGPPAQREVPGPRSLRRSHPASLRGGLHQLDVQLEQGRRDAHRRLAGLRPRRGTNGRRRGAILDRPDASLARRAGCPTWPEDKRKKKGPAQQSPTRAP